MGRYIVAVSGGVDSVVLVDMLANGADEIIVAHVEHGIRDDSPEDARFVRALAKKYGYPYQEKALNLGPNASEQAARAGRYAFLFDLAQQHGATVVTAHHGDDLAETIAINVSRGTGWRGVAVLNRRGIYRPLLPYSKADLYEYAMAHRLEWVEDKTNHDRRYLRNRLRMQMRPHITPCMRAAFLDLRNKQVQLMEQINAELRAVLSQQKELRYLITHIDTGAAIELLGEAIFEVAAIRPQRPQLERALLAVKTSKPGTTHHVGDKIELRFTTRDFSVKVLQ